MIPRFARVVEQLTYKGVITEEEATNLLQREHAAVVRKVKAMKDNCNNPCHCCCADLLAWLHERGW